MRLMQILFKPKMKNTGTGPTLGKKGGSQMEKKIHQIWSLAWTLDTVPCGLVRLHTGRGLVTFGIFCRIRIRNNIFFYLRLRPY
jgi:hypothetical protein